MPASEERIAARLEALWQIARGPGGGADRPAFSAAEATATRLVADWAREQGLAPALDRHGNLWALPGAWEGPVVTSGSHLDTVPDGGRYDGALGTVCALELALSSAQRGLLVCVAEEAPRFGAGTIGSRLLAGTLAPSALEELHDSGGVSAASAQLGYLDELADLPRTEPPLERLRAHAEIHVAQRRELRTIGVVSRVAVPRRLAIELRGAAGHAGEVSMERRRDALAAAAEVVLAIERAARAEPRETVATVGVLDVRPGAVSVIPGEAGLVVDARGTDSASLARLEAAVRDAVAQIAARRAIEASIVLLRGGEPVALDAGLAQTALEAAARQRIAAELTWSGAGHDAQHIAALAPTLLLFVPLHGGESHTPGEGADAAEIAAACTIAGEVLAGCG